MLRVSDLKTFKSVLTKDILNSDKLIYPTIDNRKVNSDSLYIAIIGERYNPLEHLDILQGNGCEYLVTTEDIKRDGLKVIKVNDIQDFTAEAAKEIAKKFQTKGGKLITISGSNGKTTTREMTYFLLSNILEDYKKNLKVITTQKNNNNHLGVPLTIFQIRPETEYGVIEFGSNHPGEIKYLCEIMSPNLGYTTNIGDSHLEFFETRENVLKEEALIKDYCIDGFFVNTDDELLQKLDGIKLGQKGEEYLFETSASRASLVNANSEIKNNYILGQHNFTNLAASICICHKLGFDFERLLKVAQNFKPTPNRSEWIELLESKVFLDAYNANPSSMLASLEGYTQYLKEKEIDLSKSCVIMGDMNELGENLERYHNETATTAMTLGHGQYVFVGRYHTHYTKGRSEGFLAFEDTNKLKESLPELLEKFDYFFVKGSRSLQLESIKDIR